MIDEPRFPWYLVTGLVVGVGLGLLVAWVAAPVERVDTHPLTLREDFKQQYRALIAAAYMADGDVGRARARLALLGDTEPGRTLASQAQLTLAEGGSQEAARALGLLAAALGQEPSAAGGAVMPETTAAGSPAAAGSGTPQAASTGTASPGNGGTALPTPTRTPTLLPTRTATATPGAPYVVEEFKPLCNPALTSPLIQVFAFDAARQAVPGVEVVVSWEGGEERFFTGLKPEFGLGYADFEMTPGEEYAVRLTNSGEPVTGLSAGDCEDEQGERYWGSWQVTFVQP